MKLKAYAKINLILNVLGTRPDGYHEVEMLMQAISLCDMVTVEKDPEHVLYPHEFEYGEADLAWKAACLAAQTFRPELVVIPEDGDACAEPAERGIRGVRCEIEKRIPAAAGLAGGSADAAAVLTGLARLWALQSSAAPAAVAAASSIDDAPSNSNEKLLQLLLPLAARLGSDVPFCLASQLGRPAAIATGTGTTLQFVKPLVSGVTLYFADSTIPDKTRAVYAELKDEDCCPIYDIRAFLAAKTLKEKRALAGNHLQAPAERLMARSGIARPSAAFPGASRPGLPSALLCGAGPTYFTLSKTGPYRTVT